MRGKAGGVDKDDESGDRRDEKGSEERITKEGWPKRSALNIWYAVIKENVESLKT